MRIFEIQLPGFDGSTDETDDKIVWIKCPNNLRISVDQQGFTVSEIALTKRIMKVALKCCDLRIVEE